MITVAWPADDEDISDEADEFAPYGDLTNYPLASVTMTPSSGGQSDPAHLFLRRPHEPLLLVRPVPHHPHGPGRRDLRPGSPGDFGRPRDGSEAEEFVRAGCRSGRRALDLAPSPRDDVMAGTPAEPFAHRADVPDPTPDGGLAPYPDHFTRLPEHNSATAARPFRGPSRRGTGGIEHEKARLHPHRIAGGHLRHRRPDRPAAARRAVGPRGGPTDADASTTSSRSPWRPTTSTTRMGPSPTA